GGRRGGARRARHRRRGPSLRAGRGIAAPPPVPRRHASGHAHNARRAGVTWTARGKVRAREIDGGAEIAIDGITTQARYYKPLVYEFFRKQFPIRPRWGEFEVELVMEYVGEVPGLDLDNLAKALLDALKGHVFF